MEALIRKAVKNDFTKVYPLFEQLWPNKKLDMPALKTVFDRAVDSKTDELLCLEFSNEMVGFCAYAVVNNFWQEGYISYVYALVVDEKYRSRGFGTMLIDAVIKESAQRGLKRVELDSGFHREKAHEFYIKLGFEKRAFLFSNPL
jgi:ribosomal protein S18 acetylase RimI-like enzyme